MGDSILTFKQSHLEQQDKISSEKKVSDFTTGEENKDRNINTEEKKMLGKRANRGYNPKYDTNETQYICKGDSTKQVVTKQEF